MEDGNSDLPLGKSGSGKIFGHTPLLRANAETAGQRVSPFH